MTIEEHAESLKETQPLTTIPGVRYYTTLTIYAEFSEIEWFDGDKELVSYVEVNPMIRELATHGWGSISKRESSRVRWLLVQAVNIAVHACNDEFPSRFHERLASRKNSRKAIAATTRKMLVSNYHRLDREEVEDPPGVSAEEGI